MIDDDLIEFIFNVMLHIARRLANLSRELRRDYGFKANRPNELKRIIDRASVFLERITCVRARSSDASPHYNNLMLHDISFWI